MVGSHLLKNLSKDDRFERVIGFSRRPTGVVSGKFDEHVIDFDKPDDWKALVTGDCLFSCLGTTIKKAGNKEVQYKIDFTYQYRMV